MQHLYKVDSFFFPKCNKRNRRLKWELYRAGIWKAGGSLLQLAQQPILLLAELNWHAHYTNFQWNFIVSEYRTSFLNIKNNRDLRNSKYKIWHWKMCFWAITTYSHLLGLMLEETTSGLTLEVWKCVKYLPLDSETTWLKAHSRDQE